MEATPLQTLIGVTTGLRRWALWGVESVAAVWSSPWAIVAPGGDEETASALRRSISHAAQAEDGPW